MKIQILLNLLLPYLFGEVVKFAGLCPRVIMPLTLLLLVLVGGGGDSPMKGAEMFIVSLRGMSLPLLKVVVFFVYVLKWSLLGVPKKVG